LNKTFYILLFFLIGGAVRLSAQVNLVPNPSFELYDTCPYDLGGDGQIFHAVPWFQPHKVFGSVILGSSSDFFNTCTTGFWSVPNNVAGYQQPRTGNGYAGIGVVVGYPDSIGGREYIEVKLNEPMKAGYMYCVEYYVVHAFGLTTDAVQAVFTPDSLLSFGFQVVHIPPGITNQGNVINDTLNWTKVSGSYLAQGGEQFMTIGNFYYNYETTVDSIALAPGDAAYYYIDDVSITLCQADIFVPNVFTPNGDGINDLFTIQETGLKQFTLKVYNRWGNEVAAINEQDLGWNGNNKDGNNCSDGVYYYLITAKGYDEKEYQYKGFVQLLR
jgi:gliding motility-associated-like protein